MRLSWLQEVKEAVQSINLPARRFAGDGELALPLEDYTTSVGAPLYKDLRTGNQKTTEAELDTILSGLNDRNVFGRFQGRFVTVDWAVDYGIRWALSYKYSDVGIERLDPSKDKYDEPKYLGDETLRKVMYYALWAARYAYSQTFIPDVIPISQLRSPGSKYKPADFDEVFDSWLTKKKREREGARGGMIP